MMSASGNEEAESEVKDPASSRTLHSKSYRPHLSN